MPFLYAQPEFPPDWDARCEALPLYFEGSSRLLREEKDSRFLVGKLKSTIFSIQAKGHIPLPGIGPLRTRLNHILCTFLHTQGIKTSTVDTRGEFLLMTKEEVAPIEIVVKSAHIGSPKHLYKGMERITTRTGVTIAPNQPHPLYVRFDWRNPLPEEDLCLPEGLADHFIDTVQAKKTALLAFEALQKFFHAYNFHLVDICFFMNTAGDVICAEISTDNSRIEYIGSDPQLRALFSSREKEAALLKAKSLIDAFESPKIFLSGPFCTGKTTLIKRVEEELGIPKLIDDATRPMREGERDGFPYHFISREEFEEKLESQFYFEWVSFHGNYYGVPKDDLFLKRTWMMDLLSTSVPAYQGKIPGLISIYLEAPAPEILRARAMSRGDSPESIQKRIEAMKDEDSTPCDYIIPDCSLEEKFRIVKAIIQRSPERERYRNGAAVESFH